MLKKINVGSWLLVHTRLGFPRRSAIISLALRVVVVVLGSVLLPLPRGFWRLVSRSLSRLLVADGVSYRNS